MITQARGQAIILSRSIPEPNSGCWLWQGHLDRHGYGDYHLGKVGGYLSAHRVAYQAFKGEIEEGKEIDHLCRVRCCVNPEHMEVVTSKVNTLRGISFSAVHAAKTHCVNGHPLSGDNLSISDGERRCRTCWRANAAAYKKRRQLLLVVR